MCKNYLITALYHWPQGTGTVMVRLIVKFAEAMDTVRSDIVYRRSIRIILPLPAVLYIVLFIALLE